MDPTAQQERGPWQLIRSAPKPVWAVTALFTLVLAVWSVLVPLYHAPDEPNHADAVMRIEEGRGWPSSLHSRVTDEGVGAIAQSPYGADGRRLRISYRAVPQSLAVPRDQRPKWEDLTALPGTHNQLLQQITQHPPGYYYYEGLTLRLGGAAGWRWDIAVSTMRLLSVLLVMWTPLLAWATAFRISGSRLAGICASIVPLAVPEFTHIGSTVNDDNLVTLAGAAALLGITCVALGDRRWSTAVWTGLWMAVALWAKAFGMVLLPLVVLAYLGPWAAARWKTRSHLRRKRERDPEAVHLGLRAWLPDRRTGTTLGVALGLALALGGWFYAINEIKYGHTSADVPGFPPGKDLTGQTVLFIRFLTQAMLARWWGSLGWFEANLPWRLVVVASVIFAALGSYALLKLRGRRFAMAVLLWPTVVTYLVVAATVTKYYLRTDHMRGLSGRYLFIGFTGIAALVGMGLGALPRKYARWAPLTLLLAGLGMQVEAGHLAVNRWWRPLNGTLRQAWDAFSAWSTWPVGVLYAGAVALLVALVVTLILLIRVGLRDVPDGIESALSMCRVSSQARPQVRSRPNRPG